MSSDPAIDEIRKTRCEISQRFGHDTKALIAHYRELQAKYAHRLLPDEPARSSTATMEGGPDGRSR